MNKLIAMLLAAAVAGASVTAVAQDKKADKKPTAEECKKDPKIKGCEEMKKK